MERDGRAGNVRGLGEGAIRREPPELGGGRGGTKSSRGLGVNFGLDEAENVVVLGEVPKLAKAAGITGGGETSSSRIGRNGSDERTKGLLGLGQVD